MNNETTPSGSHDMNIRFSGLLSMLALVTGLMLVVAGCETTHPTVIEREAVDVPAQFLVPTENGLVAPDKPGSSPGVLVDPPQWESSPVDSFRQWSGRLLSANRRIQLAAGRVVASGFIWETDRRGASLIAGESCPTPDE